MENMMATRKAGRLGQRRNAKENYKYTRDTKHDTYQFLFSHEAGWTHEEETLQRLQRLNCPAAGRESAPELCVISCMIRYKL